MSLFHKTLQDALKKLKKGDIETAKKILTEHKENELKENDFIESSLYAIKIYLHNYISHLDQAIVLVSSKEPTDEDKAKALEHIQKCSENIEAFEDGTKSLLKREGELLE